MAGEVKHTPGPWRIAGKGTIRKGDHDWIAGVNWRNRDANARLIAAAPELLEALSELVEVLRKEAPGTALNNHRFDALGIKANDAIRKATGP